MVYPYLEKISPWCSNNISDACLIGYDRFQNGLHLNRRSIKINRINLTPTTNAVKQTISIVIKYILITPAIFICINPVPLRIPNPGIIEVIIREVYSEDNTVSIRGITRKNDPPIEVEAAFFKCNIIRLSMSVKIPRDQIHGEDIIPNYHALFTVPESDVVHGFRWGHSYLGSGYRIDKYEIGALIGGDEPAMGGAHDMACAEGRLCEGDVVKLVGGQVMQGDCVGVTVVGAIHKAGTLVRGA
jgi:hypothetical protein